METKQHAGRSMRQAFHILSIVLVGLLCLFSVCNAEESPVPLVAFLTEDAHSPDLSQAGTLTVSVNHCEYGEPMQTIHNQEIVAKVASALSAMTVTGQHDQVATTGTYFFYCLLDSDGNSLFYTSFQDNLLMMPDGRYDVTGLNELYAIEGILLDTGWDDYWAEVEEQENEYLRSLKPDYPESIFTLRGYAASQLQLEDVINAEIYVSWNDEAGRLNTSDPELIRRVFSAMQGIQATGSAPEDGDGLTYFVKFSYMEPEGRFERSVWFRFEGDRLECDENTYRVSGLDELFAIEGVDVLAYLKEHYME